MERMKGGKVSKFQNKDEDLREILERSLFPSEVEFGTLIKHRHIISEVTRG